MLDTPDKWWKVKELSETTGKGLGTVSNVKSYLRDKEWLEERDHKDFRLKNTGELLHAWSKDYHRTAPIVKQYYSFDTIPELEDKISRWSLAHDRSAVLGGFSAAARYAPVVRYQRVNVYVEEQGLVEFVKDIALEPGVLRRQCYRYDPSRRYALYVQPNGQRLCCHLAGANRH